MPYLCLGSTLHVTLIIDVVLLMREPLTSYSLVVHRLPSPSAIGHRVTWYTCSSETIDSLWSDN